MSESQVNHGKRAHALLSASSAHRWLVCTPSARLEDNYPNTSSVYAEEGTLAHELAEIKLRSARNLVLKIKSTLKETQDRRKAVKAIEEHPLFSQEMNEHTDTYVNHVIAIFKRALKTDPAAVLLIEERLDFSRVVQEGFGTGDAVIIGNGLLCVCDFKYGQGNPVSAVSNPQMSLYGVGAIAALDWLYEFSKVELHIIQPRKDNISVWHTDVDSLMQWAEGEASVQSKAAYDGTGVFVTGDHCNYCRHKVHCLALAEDVFSVARSEMNGVLGAVKDRSASADDHLLEIFEMKSRVEDYLDAVAAHITQTAIEGKHWPGYKLVEGRSVRVMDSEKAEGLLLKNGYTEDDIFEKKMLGITALEKLLGKKKFSELLDKACHKPAGKPTLAKESDKRPAINVLETAQRMFGNIED